MTVDCRKCKNCTGVSCKVYGDNPELAFMECATTDFKNYKPYRCVECENFIKTTPKKWNRGKCKLGYFSCISEKTIVCTRNFKKRCK